MKCEFGFNIFTSRQHKNQVFDNKIPSECGHIKIYHFRLALAFYTRLVKGAHSIQLIYSSHTFIMQLKNVECMVLVHQLTLALSDHNAGLYLLDQQIMKLLFLLCCHTRWLKYYWAVISVQREMHPSLIYYVVFIING